MPRYDDLSAEVKKTIWEIVMAEDEAVVITSRKMRNQSNKFPTLCTQRINQSSNHQNDDIIQGILIEKARKNKVAIRVNILNFDFTNFSRFIKWYQSPIPGTKTPNGDIAVLGLVRDEATGRYEANIRVEHKITTSLERQPTKLTTWIKFSEALFKKTQIRIGAYHVLRHVEESPALRDLAASNMETDVPMDGNQVSMVGIGISHWRMEAQWRLQYGENFDSVAEWRARYA